MLMRLRMLKLSVGKGRQVIKQLCRRVLQYYATVARARGVCALQSSSCVCVGGGGGGDIMFFGWNVTAVVVNNIKVTVMVSYILSLHY